MMRNVLKNHCPLMVAGLFITVLLTYLLWHCINRAYGHFVYPLDDTYIHMAHAHNIVSYGNWGITSHEFSPSSSSLLWTVLLSACFRIFGEHVQIPLILNILFGLGALATLHFWLRTRMKNSILETILLFAFILIVPLPWLIVTGMEHTLHIFLILLFMVHSENLLSSQSRLKANKVLLLVILSMALVLARYESLFILATAGLLFFYKRQWTVGLLIWAAAWVPVLVFGFFSIKHNAHLLPNTLLLKSETPSFSLQGIRLLLSNIGLNFRRFEDLYILMLIPILVCIIRGLLNKETPPSRDMLSLLFIGTALLHFALTNISWVYRYEAFLIAMGLVVGFGALASLSGVLPWFPLHEKFKVKLALTVLMILLCYPFQDRSLNSIRCLLNGSRNIYEQQYQMGLFAKKYFPGHPIAANDIGLISYFADPVLFDLVGLASQDVADARIAKKFDTNKIDELAKRRGVQFAMIYDTWFFGKRSIPSAWFKVGEWTIQNNFVCGGDTVSFYSLRPEFNKKLIASMKEFASQLPRGVLQSGLYLK